MYSALVLIGLIYVNDALNFAYENPWLFFEYEDGFHQPDPSEDAIEEPSFGSFSSGSYDPMFAFGSFGMSSHYPYMNGAFNPYGQMFGSFGSDSANPSSSHGDQSTHGFGHWDLLKRRSLSQANQQHERKPGHSRLLKEMNYPTLKERPSGKDADKSRRFLTSKQELLIQKDNVPCDTLCFTTHGLVPQLYADQGQVHCEKQMCSGVFPKYTFEVCCTDSEQDVSEENVQDLSSEEVEEEPITVEEP